MFAWYSSHRQAKPLGGPALRSGQVMTAYFLIAAAAACGQQTVSAPKNSSSAAIATSPATAAMTREEMYAHLSSEAKKFEGHHRLVKQLIKVVRPTIAHIEAKKRSTEGPTTSTSRKPAESVVEEAGSGVVVERNGRFYVITNFHVIEGAAMDDIKVEVDGRFHTPTRLLHDRDTDLSVISLSGTEFVPARVSDSS